jgi:hypothetical protein
MAWEVGGRNFPHTQLRVACWTPDAWSPRTTCFLVPFRCGDVVHDINGGRLELTEQNEGVLCSACGLWVPRLSWPRTQGRSSAQKPDFNPRQTRTDAQTAGPSGVGVCELRERSGSAVRDACWRVSNASRLAVIFINR